MSGIRLPFSLARKLACASLVLLYLSACGSGTNQPTAAQLNAGTLGLALANGPTSSVAAPEAPSAPQLKGIQIETGPSMRPAFDVSIHDYVIDCASTEFIDFAAAFPHFSLFGFSGPGEGANAAINALGSYRTILPLKPGQRFKFYLDSATSEYSVRCLPGDFPPLTVSSPAGAAPQAEWYLFAPDFLITAAGYGPYVILTDSHGTPVWWMLEPARAFDAKIINGDKIAWNTQTNAGIGGQYVIRSFDGTILNTITGDLDGHELQETGNGTYLAIKYVPRLCPPDCADMSPWGGSPQSSVIDGEIVELDAQSNVVWSWRTRDHIALMESGAAGWLQVDGGDIIHMNAIEPDGPDGLLFSARHLNAIYHITKSTGAIDWKLGGTPRAESLTVLGDTRPTTMGPTGQVLSGQHDVRKWPDGTISVHDNGTIAKRPPFAMRYIVDTSARTAEVVESIQDSRAPASAFTGSARRLPLGHWLMAWGGLPYMTELDANGNPVLTINYNIGSGFSYRAIPVLPGILPPATLRAGMDAIIAR